jgi:hypothetical protein
VKHLRPLPSVAALILLAAASTSWADDEQPETLPTRDVEISYDISSPHRPTVVERRFWLADERLERIDGLANSSTIFDLNLREITVLNAADRTYIKLEGTPRQPVHPRAGTILERGEEVVVAGLPCTEWSWRSPRRTHTACLTSDGVLLRLVIEGNTRMEARSVIYRPQKPELFYVPPDYTPALTSEDGLMR